MNTETNNEYTLENLPTTITEDQFYCYSTKTGKIILGEVIGISAITKKMHYKIFGRTYERYGWFENGVNMFTENGFKFFPNYQEFIKSYNEYLLSKVKKRNTNKTRYIVSKVQFSCKMTKASFTPYNSVEFDNKKDAIDYANKGLAKIKKEANKFYEELIKLKDELKQIRANALKIDYGLVSVAYPEITPASPYSIKENDILTKIDLRKFKKLSYLDVDDNYIVSVKYFDSPGVARLSDNTIFIVGENNRSYPRLIQYSQAKKAKKRCKNKAINRIIEETEWEIKNLIRLLVFVEEYKPFKNYSKTIPYYNSKSTKDIIDDLKEIVKLFSKEDE